MRFIIWERSVQKKTDFWIVLCCILKEPKINMLEFSCWCKKNSQSIHEELHSIPLIFLNKKSEIWNDFTIFEKWKVKNFLPSLFSRSESENQMTQNRDREVNFQKKSREFSRIETLAGHCYQHPPKSWSSSLTQIFNTLAKLWYLAAFQSFGFNEAFHLTPSPVLWANVIWIWLYQPGMI